MITELNSEKLTPEEFQRLDSLLSSARSFHYLSIILAGLSLAVSSLDQASDITLPFGNIALPLKFRLQLACMFS